MAYSESRIVLGGLVHVPVLIFIANFIKNKFGVETKKGIENIIKEESIKVIEAKGTVVKEGKTKGIKQFSSKLDIIDEKTDEVYEKVKKKKKDKKKNKKKDMKRD